jgi:hypothetical protein
VPVWAGCLLECTRQRQLKVSMPLAHVVSAHKMVSKWARGVHSDTRCAQLGKITDAAPQKSHMPKRQGGMRPRINRGVRDVPQRYKRDECVDMREHARARVTLLNINGMFHTSIFLIQIGFAPKLWKIMEYCRLTAACPSQDKQCRLRFDLHTAYSTSTNVFSCSSWPSSER